MWGLVSCFALFTTVASAQFYEGRRISAIQFSPAVQPIPDLELRESLPLKSGDVYSAAKVRVAMGALFRTGRYGNLSADVKSEAEGLVLTFVTEVNSFIGNVDVLNPPSASPKGALITAAKLSLGRLFEESALNQSSDVIQTELRLAGFYDAKVRYEIDRDSIHHQVDIRFFVESGPRARFSKPILKGDLKLSYETLIQPTKWLRLRGMAGWQYVSEQRVQGGIRNMLKTYRKNNFLIAKVALERLDFKPQQQMAIPSLRIDAGPKVQLRATGVKISQTNLRRLIPIYEEQSVDKDLLLEGNRKVSAYLRGQGYFDAKVDYEVEQDEQPVTELDPKKDAFVDYDVTLGPRYKVATLTLTGNHYFDNATLLERMAIRAATFIRYRRGRYSDELLASDRAAIEELYRSNGFLGVKVSSSANRKQNGKAYEVGIAIDVREGPQTKIEALQIEGVADTDRAVIEPNVASTIGQPYSLLTINGDRERILSLLYGAGYSDAALDTIVERGQEADTIRLIYRIQAGTQHFVRDVVVTGLSRTNDSLVNPRIQIKPGEPLSNNEIFASQRRLYDLGIFATVDTALQNPDGNEISKIVLFNLEEASRWGFNGGLGAEIARIGGGSVQSFDSPGGSAGFAPRISFGVNRMNLFGMGHTVGAQTRLSTIQKRVLVSYLVPQFRGSDHLSVSATALYDDAKNVRTYNAKRLEGALQLAQRLSKSEYMQYRYTFRKVVVDPDSIKVDPGLIPLLAQPVRVGSLSTTFIQDRRDDPTDAKRGRYTTADFGVASSALGSTSNFVRLLTRNSTYHRIKKEFIFARSINFGIMAPFTSGPDVPVPERFYAGGAYSHRGFAENQAGPRDLKTGYPLGGKALLVNSLELRFPMIGDNLGGVFFHDAGNVYSELKTVSLRWRQNGVKDFNYMVHAFGFGIRYRTPIGPVRVDLAFVPNSPYFSGFEGSRDDLLFGRGKEALLRLNQFQFHISLGQAF